MHWAMPIFTFLGVNVVMARKGFSQRVVLFLSLLLISTAQAAPVVFSDRLSFEAALDVSMSKMDFDTVIPSTHGGPVTTSDPRFLPFGMDVINGTPGFTSFLVNTTNYPSHAPDAPIYAMFNGSGTADTSDDFAMNVTMPSNAFGIVPNRIDGGRVLVYSGPNLTGTLLAEIVNTGSGAFLGVVTDGPIGSVQVTCEFDADFTCGLIDPTIGVSSLRSLDAGGSVPAPGVVLLMLTGLLAMRRLAAKR